MTQPVVHVKPKLPPSAYHRAVFRTRGAFGLDRRPIPSTGPVRPPVKLPLLLARLPPLLVFAWLGLIFGVARVQAQFAGGAGTPADPYRIASAAQLDAIRTRLNGGGWIYFLQVADIDLKGTGDPAQGWIPIDARTGLGLFDGGGYKIRNLRVRRPEGEAVGLFGVAKGEMPPEMSKLRLSMRDPVVLYGHLRTRFGHRGAIRNVVLEDVEVEGKNRVGALVGWLQFMPGGLENCYATGVVRGESQVGGLAGTASGSPLLNCFAAARVREGAAGEAGETASAGGLVGLGNFFSQFFNCFYDAETSGCSDEGKGVGVVTAVYERIPFVNRMRSAGVAKTEVLEALIRQMQCEDAAFGDGAADALRVLRFEPAQLGGPIAGAFSGSREDSRAALLRVLELLGPDYERAAAEALGGILRQTGGAPRREALLTALAARKGRLYHLLPKGWREDVVRCLIAELASGDEAVLEAAAFVAEALGMDAAAAGNPLTALLGHASARVRARSAEALGNLVRSFQSPAVEALTRMLESDPANDARRAAARALGRVLARGFAGGTGTESDPYLVATPGQLHAVRWAVRSGPGNYFRQVADIDMGPFTAAGPGWMPISSDEGLAGYDGSGFRIANLRMDRPDLEYAGLFGKIGSGGPGGAAIRGVQLENVRIRARRYAGAFAGEMRGAGGLLRDCAATGTVSAQSAAAGLVYAAYGAVLSGCVADVNPQVEGAPGEGLVSILKEGARVEDCFFSASRPGVSRLHGTPRAAAELAVVCAELRARLHAARQVPPQTGAQSHPERALSRMRDVIRILLKIGCEPGPEAVRFDVLFALAETGLEGGAAEPLLAGLVEDPGAPPNVRRMGVRVVGKNGGPEAVRVLRSRLMDPSPAVRSEAAGALIRMGTVPEGLSPEEESEVRLRGGAEEMLAYGLWKKVEHEGTVGLAFVMGGYEEVDSARELLHRMLARGNATALSLLWNERTRPLLGEEERRRMEDLALREIHRLNLSGFGQAFRFQRDGSVQRLGRVQGSENQETGLGVRTMLCAQTLCESPRFGTAWRLAGKFTLGEYLALWTGYWRDQLCDRARTCLDVEIAQNTGYNLATVGGFFTLCEFVKDPALKRLAVDFLTLYWAETAAELHPRNGQRAAGASRDGEWSTGSFHWAKPLFHAYGWVDEPAPCSLIHHGLFFNAVFRPPAILRGIVRDPGRDAILSTSRRSTVRRDVYYTPEYSIGSITHDPVLEARRPAGKEAESSVPADFAHRLVAPLRITMGVRFADAGGADRILIKGRGNNPPWECNGFTGPGVLVAARSPLAGEAAGEGQLRYASNGTRVFFSDLKREPRREAWRNVEEGGDWLFTRCGDAYAAVRIASGGYRKSDSVVKMVDRKESREEQTSDGHFLDLDDLWAPVVVQMGRAREQGAFEAFKQKVAATRFEFDAGEGRLDFTSLAGDRYEFWRKNPRMPRFNGIPVRNGLEMPYAYINRYVSMKNGSAEARICCPGFSDLALDFSTGAPGK